MNNVKDSPLDGHILQLNLDFEDLST